jgi:IS605 OrfB family transposase
LRNSSKEVRRTVVVECYANKSARKALREIENAYREMLKEMVEYALKHGASQSTLHEVFYERFRLRFPWLPTRVIKGAYRDAVRRAKSFRGLKKRGRAYTEKPEVRRVTITYSDSQDWRVENGVIKLRTQEGWVQLHYKTHKLLRKYVYSDWRLASELRLRITRKKIIAYLTFTKSFEVAYEPQNVVAVDVNENNVTMAVFNDGVLSDIHRVETNLGRMVIAYAERRKRITRGNSTKAREVRKKLKKLREGERKLDVLRKTAKFIERLAIEKKAVVVVGNVNGRAKERMEENVNNRLRHRIHQWSVSTLIKLLDEKPIRFEKVSENGTSSRDPFTGFLIKGYEPLVIRTAVRGLRRVKVVKTTLRVVRVCGEVVERDVVGAINIGLRYLSSGGRPVALASTGAHEVRATLVTPHGGATPLTVLQVFTDTVKYR